MPGDQWGARRRGSAPVRSGGRRMWALRAAVRPRAWVSPLVRVRPALRTEPLLPPCPVRALAAFGPGGPGDLQGRRGGGRGPRADGPGGLAGAEEEEEDAEEEEEEEELLRREPLLPAGTQRVCLVHPEVKWGPAKPQLTRGDGAGAVAPRAGTRGAVAEGRGYEGRR